MTFHVIMAAHNRRALTIRSVESAIAAASIAECEIHFIVFDDGSADGTREALLGLDARIDVISGDGSAFWARSMAIAEAALLARNDLKDDDWVVWLNDDTVVDPTAFVQFFASGSAVTTAVTVGAMRDPVSGSTTYGGYRKTGWHPLRFTPVGPSEHPIAIDTFNGNLVLVPVPIARLIGGIDGDYSHALADIDYGLRCYRLGVEVLLLPGTLGTCPRNAPDPQDGLRRKWRRFVGVKGGGNYASLTRIVRKGHPRTWPMYVLATYVLWWGRNLLRQPWRRMEVTSG